MQLKNNLYKIISKEEDSSMVNYTIELNPSCVIYQAHFPKEPITPGVCIVQIGKELIDELFTEKMSVSCKLEIVKVKNVKFLSVISPRDTLHIMYQMKKVELSDDNKMVEAQWVVLSDEKVMAKTSLVMKVV